MKRYMMLLGSALYALLLPLSANADSCGCSEPAKPGLPDALNATSEQMQAADAKVNAYINEMKTYKQCMAQCVTDSNNEAKDLVAKWNRTAESFNKRQSQ